MAQDLREAAKDTLIKAALDEVLTGQERAIGKAIGSVLQANMSFPAFLASVNDDLSSKDLRLELPSNTFKRKNLRTNSYGTYEAECRLYQISGGGPCLDTAELSIIINRKYLMAQALYQFATFPDQGTNDYLIWAFETDFMAGGSRCVEDGLMCEAVQDCNACLAASRLQRGISIGCRPVGSTISNGGRRVEYNTQISLMQMTERIEQIKVSFDITIDYF